MSNNWISNGTQDVEKKWCNIRANSVSIGSVGTLDTKVYQPVITIQPADGVINDTYQASYTCNGKTLSIHGIVDFTSTATSTNTIRIYLTNLPSELSSTFLNKDSSCSGYLSEYDTNTLTNTGNIVRCSWNTNQLEMVIFYSKQNTSVCPFKVRYFIQINNL